MYLQTYPTGPDKWQVSSDGGEEPRWSVDGDELFYRNGDEFLSASVELGAEPSIGTPQVLLEGPCLNTAGHSYEVTPDGRFLLMEALQGAQPAQINVIVDFFAQLKLSEADSSRD